MGLMYFKYKILNVEICKQCICLLLENKLVKTASRWQQFVIESLSHSNDSFKTSEYCRSESNDCFYEWFSESVIHPSQRFGFEHKMKQKQRSCSCHITVRSIFTRIS